MHGAGRASKNASKSGTRVVAFGTERRLGQVTAGPPRSWTIPSVLREGAERTSLPRRPGEQGRGKLTSPGASHVLRLLPEARGAVLTRESELDPPAALARPGEGDRQVRPIQSFRPSRISGKQTQPYAVARSGPAIRRLSRDERPYLAESPDPDVRPPHHRPATVPELRPRDVPAFPSDPRGAIASNPAAPVAQRELERKPGEAAAGELVGEDQDRSGPLAQVERGAGAPHHTVPSRRHIVAASLHLGQVGQQEAPARDPGIRRPRQEEVALAHSGKAAGDEQGTGQPRGNVLRAGQRVEAVDLDVPNAPQAEDRARSRDLERFVAIAEHRARVGGESRVRDHHAGGAWIHLAPSDRTAYERHRPRAEEPDDAAHVPPLVVQLERERIAGRPRDVRVDGARTRADVPRDPLQVGEEGVCQLDRRVVTEAVPVRVDAHHVRPIERGVRDQTATVPGAVAARPLPRTLEE